MTAARALNAASEALVVKDLYKSFSGLDVLKGVSLEARQGDVISMIGSSGSGKSTFLRCINLLEIPDRGIVSVNGETIAMKPGPGGTQMPADTGKWTEYAPGFQWCFKL